MEFHNDHAFDAAQRSRLPVVLRALMPKEKIDD